MDHSQLIEQALIARQAAYAPYSHFQVGAAVLCRDGRVFHGCNIENASYGLCSCAERTALFSAIAAGYQPGDFAALAVVGESEGPISPCGACRQVMLELGGGELPVIRANLRGAHSVSAARDLLPDAFSGAELPASPRKP
ncbi:MAG: cytidine deaminase [Gammaproteobacteria bacterium HGW-Gammaproteobacteria-2]|jgi:cytidine deaminase|nr:MAG: cytidine deaminase [Gammaproteobacteria bacterium HGW-Gammaproteobacteria-2]